MKGRRENINGVVNEKDEGWKKSWKTKKIKKRREREKETSDGGREGEQVKINGNLDDTELEGSRKSDGEEEQEEVRGDKRKVREEIK